MLKPILMLVGLTLAVTTCSCLTPLDAIKDSAKINHAGAVDLRGISPDVFNATAFAKDNIMQGKHFAPENRVYEEMLAAEQAAKDWMNKTAELV